MTQVSSDNSSKRSEFFKCKNPREKACASLAIVTAVVMLVLSSLLAYGYLGSFSKFYFTAAILTAGAIVPMIAGFYYLCLKSPKMNKNIT
jgi:hypothetical protein